MAEQQNFGSKRLVVGAHYGFRDWLSQRVTAALMAIFTLLLIAQVTAPGVIQSAALVTLLGFTGLTVLVFVTRKDFSFLGGLLGWCGVVALLLIVSGAVVGALGSGITLRRFLKV